MDDLPEVDRRSLAALTAPIVYHGSTAIEVAPQQQHEKPEAHAFYDFQSGTPPDLYPSGPSRREPQRGYNIGLLWALIFTTAVAIAGIALGAYFGTQYASIKNSCTAQPASGAGASVSTTSPAAGTTTATIDLNSFTPPAHPAAISRLADPPFACPTGVAAGSYNASVTFKTYCNMTYGALDITGLIAYTMADCLDACIAYNENVSRVGNATCQAVSMALSLGFWATHGINANCYLKRGPLPSPDTMSPSGALGDVWTAVMCKDAQCNSLYA